MKNANYYIFGEIWSLLERLQIINRIRFDQFDLDNPSDVSLIIENWLRPFFEMASDANKSLIKSSFEYYMTTRAAPFRIYVLVLKT